MTNQTQVPETLNKKIDWESLSKTTLEMRRDIIKMLGIAGSGHPGGSLSITDILALLYFHFLRHDAKNPKWPDRDRLIFSKGHGCPALYSALAHAGYFDKKLLLTLRQLGSPLQGHPDVRRLAGIEASTGSLGQGLSVAIGCALAAKLGAKWDYSGDAEVFNEIKDQLLKIEQEVKNEVEAADAALKG